MIVFDPVELDDRWHLIPAYIQIGGSRGAIISVKYEHCDRFYGGGARCICDMTAFVVYASIMKFDRYGIPYSPRYSWRK